mgnify:CR=1 FL=1
MGTFNGKRPAHVTPPAHLSKSPPVPQPDPIDNPTPHDEELSPVRYGDWERKGGKGVIVLHPSDHDVIRHDHDQREEVGANDWNGELENR